MTPLGFVDWILFLVDFHFPLERRLDIYFKVVTEKKNPI